MKFSLFSATTTLTALTTASRLAPFILPSLTTHQPNGNPTGQVNYYRIAFNINSTNSGSPSSGYCATFWGDNSWAHPEAYSLFVPTDRWFQCDSSAANLGDGQSPFMFKLFEYFSIGNYSLEVKEAVDGGNRSVYGFSHVTNTTSAYTCTINPQELQYIVHASGDCSIAEGHAPFKIPAVKAEKSSWF